MSKDRIETQTEQEDRHFKKLVQRGIIVTRTPNGLHWEWKLTGDKGNVADFVELMSVLADRLSVMEALLGIDEKQSR